MQAIPPSGQEVRPGWRWHLDEVSNNVYRARLVDPAGRQAETSGSDPAALLAWCLQAAADVERQTRPQ